MIFRNESLRYILIFLFASSAIDLFSQEAVEMNFSILLHKPVAIIQRTPAYIQWDFPHPASCIIDKNDVVHMTWLDLKKDRITKLFYTYFNKDENGEAIKFEEGYPDKINFNMSANSNFDEKGNFYVFYCANRSPGEYPTFPCYRYFDRKKFGDRICRDDFEFLTDLLIDKKGRIHFFWTDKGEQHFRLFVDENIYEKIGHMVLSSEGSKPEIFKPLPRGRFYNDYHYAYINSDKIYLLWDKLYKKMGRYHALMMNVWDGVRWSEPTLLFEKKVKAEEELFAFKAKPGLKNNLIILAQDQEYIKMYEIHDNKAQLIHSVAFNAPKKAIDFAILNNGTISLLFLEMKGDASSPWGASHSIFYGELKSDCLNISERRLSIEPANDVLGMQKDSKSNIYIIFSDQSRETERIGYIFGEYKD